MLSTLPILLYGFYNDSILKLHMTNPFSMLFTLWFKSYSLFFTYLWDFYTAPPWFLIARTIEFDFPSQEEIVYCLLFLKGAFLMIFECFNIINGNLTINTNPIAGQDEIESASSSSLSTAAPEEQSTGENDPIADQEENDERAAASPTLSAAAPEEEPTNKNNTHENAAASPTLSAAATEESTILRSNVDTSSLEPLRRRRNLAIDFNNSAHLDLIHNFYDHLLDRPSYLPHSSPPTEEGRQTLQEGNRLRETVLQMFQQSIARGEEAEVN